MIDPLKEHVIPLSKAVALDLRQRGKKAHVNCAYRWTKQGCSGVVLESIQWAGKRCTSHEAVARFLARLAQADRLK